jgi:molecular chaperone DnaJ
MENIISEFLNFQSIRHMPIDGEDLKYDLAISFREGLMGGRKNIDIPRAETCPACSGRGTWREAAPKKCADCKGTGLETNEKIAEFGRAVIRSRCATCKGTGEAPSKPCTVCHGKTWVKKTHPFTVDLPVGIDSGARLCFPGLGAPGRYGGRPGNLNLDISVAEHPLFDRVGRAVFIRLPISKSIAKQGGQATVPRPDGKGFFLLTVPPKTPHGAEIRAGETGSYILTAIIDTYNPHNPFSMLGIKKRLQAIDKMLNDRF